MRVGRGLRAQAAQQYGELARAGSFIVAPLCSCGIGERANAYGKMLAAEKEAVRLNQKQQAARGYVYVLSSSRGDNQVKWRRRPMEKASARSAATSPGRRKNVALCMWLATRHVRPNQHGR